MVSDEELDGFIEEELKKDITQEDKVDDSVEQHLGEMGFLWERVQQKLQEDKECFKCKKPIFIDKKEIIQVLEVGSPDKGLIAFCSLCSKCIEKIKKEQDEKEKKNEVKKND